MAAGQFVRPVRDDNQQWQRGEGAGEESQEVEAGRVAPVEVVEQQDGGPYLRERGEEVAHLLEERRLAGDRANRAATGEGDGEGRKAVARLAATEQFRPRAVGGRVGEIVASPYQHERAPLPRFGAECLREGGLADPRVTADEHEATMPGDGGDEMIAHQRQFPSPPDEVRWMQGRQWPDHRQSLPDATAIAEWDYTRCIHLCFAVPTWHQDDGNIGLPSSSSETHLYIKPGN